LLAPSNFSFEDCVANDSMTKGLVMQLLENITATNLNGNMLQRTSMTIDGFSPTNVPCMFTDSGEGAKSFAMAAVLILISFCTQKRNSLSYFFIIASCKKSS